jgi:type VI secretion system protein ImpG
VDRRFRDLYSRELRHLESSAQEFAREFPRIAHALSLDDLPCPDPYVERLLEGFAFLAARVQSQIEAGYPRVAQSLLESIYPNYLAPTPSMAMLRLEPDPTVQELKDGVRVPRDALLRWKGSKMAAPLPADARRGPAPPDLHRVLYRTAHDVTLYPLRLTEARYFTRDLAALRLGDDAGDAQAALLLKLSTVGEPPWSAIAADELPLHLGGTGTEHMRLYEALLARATTVLARPADPLPGWGRPVRLPTPARVGFSAAEALLPTGPRSFNGYRLLHEYFAFPQRFMTVALRGLRTVTPRVPQGDLELIVLLDREDQALERWQQGDPRRLRDALHLFTTPAVNLFPRKADGVIITDYAPEHHVVVDRGAPDDYEVHTVLSVTGYDARGAHETAFHPFYAARHTADDRRAYFSVARTPRGLSAAEARAGRRSSYAGSEVHVSLVDASCAPVAADINRLDVSALCTNRDLPRFIQPDPARETDFAAELPGLRAVKLVGRPSDPWPSPVHGETMWKLVGHLSVNYLTLLDASAEMGAAAVRELLGLYADRQGDADATEGVLWLRKQIAGLRSVERAALTSRLDQPGPITFARGVELTVEFDDRNFEGSGPFLLGAVLDQFFARYVSINSFTQTVVRTRDRGELIRWPATLGNRPIL